MSADAARPTGDRGGVRRRFIGAVARAGLVDVLPHGGTLVANLVGTFALGYFVTMLHERLPLSAYRRPFLGTGLCGALTTFSMMQIELLDLLDDGRVVPAAAYASGSRSSTSSRPRPSS